MGQEGVKLSDQRFKDMSGCNIFSDENSANQNAAKLSEAKKRSLYDTHLFDDTEKTDAENTKKTTLSFESFGCKIKRSSRERYFFALAYTFKDVKRTNARGKFLHLFWGQ
eukprot:TRINITY_DN12675_c0_g1_i1.p3 TRINITY_DN12675_c0_g1~~TRINITY_DN12675_c0_g1_i1.p3  ORF type:complete len:110 (+),score=13.73 TRINITY_DN12675_c0_g1_i1:170-499(+)